MNRRELELMGWEVADMPPKKELKLKTSKHNRKADLNRRLNLNKPITTNKRKQK